MSPSFHSPSSILTGKLAKKFRGFAVVFEVKKKKKLLRAPECLLTELAACVPNADPVQIPGVSLLCVQPGSFQSASSGASQILQKYHFGYS